MTPEIRRLLALVELNRRTHELHADFSSADGNAEIAAVLKQIGEGITICVGLMVKARAQREAAVERFEVES